MEFHKIKKKISATQPDSDYTDEIPPRQRIYKVTLFQYLPGNKIG